MILTRKRAENGDKADTWVIGLLSYQGDSTLCCRRGSYVRECSSLGRWSLWVYREWPGRPRQKPGQLCGGQLDGSHCTKGRQGRGHVINRDYIWWQGSLIFDNPCSSLEGGRTDVPCGQESGWGPRVTDKGPDGVARWEWEGGRPAVYGILIGCAFALGSMQRWYMGKCGPSWEPAVKRQGGTGDHSWEEIRKLVMNLQDGKRRGTSHIRRTVALLLSCSKEVSEKNIVNRH